MAISTGTGFISITSHNLSQKKDHKRHFIMGKTTHMPIPTFLAVLTAFRKSDNIKTVNIFLETLGNYNTVIHRLMGNNKEVLLPVLWAT